MLDVPFVGSNIADQHGDHKNHSCEHWFFLDFAFSRLGKLDGLGNLGRL
jgi:hypothetical protein